LDRKEIREIAQNLTKESTKYHLAHAIKACSDCITSSEESDGCPVYVYVIFSSKVKESAVVKTALGNYIIFIPITQNMSLSKSTDKIKRAIGHELGHIFLTKHRVNIPLGEDGKEIEIMGGSRDKQEEVEADYFSEILINSRNAILREYYNGGILKVLGEDL